MPTSPAKSAGTREISDAEWRKLPCRWRIAIGASLVEEVAAMYSAYFRKRFKLDDTIRAAWRFACGGRLSALHFPLLQRHLDSLQTAEGEMGEYGWSEACMGVGLLAEIDKADGKNIGMTVSCAAWAYVSARIYEFNVNTRDLAVEETEAMEPPVYVAA